MLFIADEIQTGIARTGELLAVCHEGVKPDILFPEFYAEMKSCFV